MRASRKRTPICRCSRKTHARGCLPSAQLSLCGSGCPGSSPIAAAVAFADPLHPKRIARASPRVYTSYSMLMPHERTESDLENLEIRVVYSLLKRTMPAKGPLPSPVAHRPPRPNCTVISMIYGPAGFNIKWMGIAARLSGGLFSRIDSTGVQRSMHKGMPQEHVCCGLAGSIVG